jgi:hypothetical protein
MFTLSCSSIFCKGLTDIIEEDKHSYSKKINMRPLLYGSQISNTSYTPSWTETFHTIVFRME